jgi:hypothetical protein
MAPALILRTAAGSSQRRVHKDRASTEEQPPSPAPFQSTTEFLTAPSLILQAQEK